jgi:foldase protein PrsA
MTRSFGPTMLAIGVGLLGSAAAFGCGGSEDGLPQDTVAEVGDAMITKSDFERALRFATGRGNDPRDRPACVAAKQQESTRDADGKPLDEAELEKQCKAEYEQIKSNVMDYLIKREWTRQEAQARGIVLTDAQIRNVVDKAEQSGLFDTETLRRAGIGERELLARVRHNQLHAKVTEQVTERSRKVSTRDIASYYRQKKTEFAVPDQREMRIVITRTRARAEAARTALDAGRSWESVAKQHSTHISRKRGGRITAEWKGENKAGLGAAIFRAKRGELIGPVKDDLTWAVFVVDEIKPSYQPTLEQTRDEIRDLLASRQRQQALAAFTESYRAKTTCAPGYTVPACKNGPKQSEDPSST